MIAVYAGVFGAAAGAGLAWIIHEVKTRARFKRSLKKRAVFIGAVAHQLRTPLDQVLGIAQSLTMRADQFAPEDRELVETLSGSGLNLKGALLDVLDMLDIESDQIRLDRNVEFLPDCIDYVQKIAKPLANQNETNIEFDVKPSAMSWLYYDEVRLRQCMASIVRQCIDQTPKGNVSVTVENLPDKKKNGLRNIIVTIRDDSGGMNQKMAECYFSPTKYKINRYMKNAEGSVLALVLSRNLARKMGGDLTVKSAFANGVTFTLTVPSKLAKAPKEYNTDNDLTMQERAARLAAGKTIMIVEDNEVNIQILKVFLKKIGSNNVLIARNGQEALDQVASEACDLVLMDIQMPVMDGITATQKIRASKQKWRQVPIIAVTAAARGSEREACEKAGVTAFLAKPVSAEALYQKIVRVLARG